MRRAFLTLSVLTLVFPFFFNLADEAGAAEPNLAAYWNFEEGTGTIAYDSASDNDGQLMNGPVWTAGYINGGLSFDGVNDYINVPDDPSLRFTQSSSFSICQWVKPSTGGYFLSKMRANGARNVFGYQASWHSIYKYFSFVVEQSYIMNTIVSTPNDSAPAGSWYHVSYVYQNRSMKIYLNGQLSASGTFTGSTGTTSPDKNMTIGVRSYDSIFEMYFGGTLDDIRIYNRALTDTEVWQLYQSGL
jgi:hypothetical protein